MSSAEEHFEIFDALAAGDASAIEDVMRRHIRHVRGLWAPRGVGWRGLRWPLPGGSQVSRRRRSTCSATEYPTAS